MNEYSKLRRMIGPAVAIAVGVGLAIAPAESKRVEAAPAKVLTEDSRGMVSARIGVPIEIMLRAQPGTGFSWVPKGSANLVTELKPMRSSKARPGSWQTQRFRFIAPRPGTYRVAFSYDQPWRGGIKGTRTKGFLIIVR